MIYNGVSPRFRPDVPRGRAGARRARSTACRAPYLLFLGGEKPHKNVQNVVRAFAEARQERSLPHVARARRPDAREPPPGSRP